MYNRTRRTELHGTNVTETNKSNQTLYECMCVCEPVQYMWPGHTVIDIGDGSDISFKNDYSSQSE